MNFCVITMCTNRKRHPPSLGAEALHTGSVTDVADEWVRRVDMTPERVAANELYCGRTYLEATAVAQNVNAPLWFVSAGMGLVSSLEQIPPYSLTISNGSDNVGRKISDDKWSTADWWDAITVRRGGLSIAKLIGENPKCIMLFALSEQYAKMIRRDIESVHESELCRLRFFGLGLKRVIHERFHDCVLPYDHKLNGPDSNYKGTMGDIAQRAMRHFGDLVKENPTTLCIDSKVDQNAVTTAISDWRSPKKFERKRQTDDEIHDLIKSNWDITGGRSGRMLRHLRDDLNFACEQGRFKNLFKKTAEEKNRGKKI